MIVLSAVWILGVASGGRSILQPLNHLSVATNPTVSTGSPSLPQGAAAISSLTAKQQLLGSRGARNNDVNLSVIGNVIGSHPKFERVSTVAQLEQLLEQSTRPVMLDFYADWCVSCKEMEAFTFIDPRVVQRMGQMLLLQVDVTANNADDRALMKKFRLFGPPGIIFFKPGGSERKGHKSGWLSGCNALYCDVGPSVKVIRNTTSVPTLIE